MSEGLLHAELQAACSALGYSDGAKYYKEADCLETVKDLIRYLKKDDESHEIRRALGETRVLQTDLIHLLRECSNDDELFDVTLRLIVNLTNPVLLLFHEELPEEKVTRNHFLQILSQQQTYKESFADEKLWSVLVGKLSELLQRDADTRQEEDGMIIERILIMIRNILSVPASPDEEKRTDDDASLHDQVLWALHLAGFEDLILYMASSSNEQNLCMHVLEIVSLMLKEQDPEQLAQAKLQRSQVEKEKDEQELLETRRQEAIKKQQQFKKYHGARHSRFGGTFCVQNMKSISDRDIISHKPLTDVQSINFDRTKRSKKIAKNRMPLLDKNLTRRSTLAIRLFLQEFCTEFLSGAYNFIMYIVKENLSRARGQEHDESYYLWIMRFFLEFNRYHQFKVELVSETLHIQTFHYIQTNLETYFEMMTTDKKKIPLWSRRMHRGLGAYRELLMTLALMDKSTDESVKQSANVLKSKVFYVPEYREMCLILLNNFDEKKMSITYLKDLVETTHVLIKLMEQFCGKSKHILTKKVIKKPNKNKKKAKQNKVLEPTEEELHGQWNEMSSELSAIIQGEADLPETVPFDAVSDQTEDEQKEISMRKINLLLRKKEMAEAVSLMRSSREVWPEGDIFGAGGLSPEDEFMALREVFMANLNPIEQQPVQEEELNGFDDEDEEDEEDQYEDRETELKIDEFIRRFANIKVMMAYSKLLDQYEKNSKFTNHCIMKMCHRIGFDAKLPAMFYQASIFRVFLKAMEDPKGDFNESVKEIARFGKYIVRQFFTTAETNSKVFVELLFWKNNKEATEIECGYDDSSTKSSVKAASWLEEEEDELQRLHGEFRFMEERPEGKDVLDLIEENMINKRRTRRQIVAKLKDMGLINNAQELKRKSVKVKGPKTWLDEEEEELKMLVEEYKDHNNPMGMIMDMKVIKRPKQRVIDKILEMGLVNDSSELKKKRVLKVKKPKKSKKDPGLGDAFEMANQGDSDSDEDIVDDWSDSDEEKSKKPAKRIGADGKIKAKQSKKKDDSDTSDDESDDNQSKPTSSKAPYRPPVATPALISSALKTVKDAGMEEPIGWLSSLLKDTADDREEDGEFEPVPILALSESCTDAMEDSNFQNLLKLIGIHPPVTHQEMFWRIPSRLTVEGLRKRAQYLSQGLEGIQIADEDADTPLEPTQKRLSTQKTKKKKKTPKKTTKNKRKNKVVSDEENIDPDDKENISVSRNDSSDDDDDDDRPLSRLSSAPSASQNSINNDSKGETKKKGKKLSKKDFSTKEESDGDESKLTKKRRFVINDDSDDETDMMDSHDLKLHLDTEPTQETNKSRIIDSDDENDQPSTKQTSKRLIESDSEDDVPLTSRKKAKILDDSDED
uniref:Timeless 2 n=1 Tax=Euphausia superba TaxID=6819 RepID=A0A2I6BQ55_EUPSU|nr:timeless 2 [Euphausia superba]